MTYDLFDNYNAVFVKYYDFVVNVLILEDLNQFIECRWDIKPILGLLTTLIVVPSDLHRGLTGKKQAGSSERPRNDFFSSCYGAIDIVVIIIIFISESSVTTFQLKLQLVNCTWIFQLQF